MNEPSRLQLALELGGIRVCKAKGTVLFRRGQKCLGTFVVLDGCVTLDFGAECAVGHICSWGALVGLPATLTKREYSMTATVSGDACLSFWSPAALDSLLRKHPEFCLTLLSILGEKVTQTHRLQKAILGRERTGVTEATIA